MLLVDAPDTDNETDPAVPYVAVQPVKVFDSTRTRDDPRLLPNPKLIAPCAEAEQDVHVVLVRVSNKSLTAST